MSEITRSMEATAAGVAARVDRQRRALPNGWWGMVLFVSSEATLFGSLIATYFYLRFSNSTWPPAGIEPPSVTLPLVFTGMLIAGVVPIWASLRAARAGSVGGAWALLAVSLAVQATYLGLQIHLFVNDYNDFQPTGSAYGSIYFTLLGIHHAHVAVGLLLDVWLLGKLARGITNYRLIALRAISFYWYFVAAIAVPVVFTQLYPSL
jgi:heme/copper-type cytochrome/quinol oxidase subunit 3